MFARGEESWTAASSTHAARSCRRIMSSASGTNNFFFSSRAGFFSSIGGWRSWAGVGSCDRSIGGTVSVRRAAARRDRTPKRRSIDGGGGQPNEGGDSRESFETPRDSGIDRVIAGGKPRMREREESSPRLPRGRAQSSIERQTSPFAPQGGGVDLVTVIPQTGRY